MYSYYRLMMGLTALTLRSLKSSVMVRLYLTIFDYIRIAHNLLAFYVILAIGLALSIFSIIVNSLLIHGVRKVNKLILSSLKCTSAQVQHSFNITVGLFCKSNQKVYQ